jgi:hypothetical protein
MYNLTRHITHVAVIHKGILYSLPRPYRHHHVLWAMNKIDPNTKQGFLDNCGRYLSRTKAMIVAQEAKQLLSNEPLSAELFSEDVWTDKDPCHGKENVFAFLSNIVTITKDIVR